MARSPGAALAGFPIVEGLLETELKKAVANAASQRNIEQVRQHLHLSGPALLAANTGRRKPLTRKRTSR